MAVFTYWQYTIESGIIATTRIKFQVGNERAEK